MSDLKIDARLKEINIKIRTMEGEYTKRKLESTNGLNEELHAIDNKFHEELRNLKENYMIDRQSIEDRYFADKKAIDKEYEDKRLDLIDSIKEVIGDISEVTGFTPAKPEKPVATFESADNGYTSIFNNKETIEDSNVIKQAPVIETPLTSLDDIEDSLEEVTSGFGPIEPAIEEAAAPIVENNELNIETPEFNNVSLEQPTFENQVISQNVVVEPVVSVPVQPEPIVANEAPQVAFEVQPLEEVQLTPVNEQPVMVNMPPVPEVEMVAQTAPEVSAPQVVNQVVEQPVQEVNVTNQSVPETNANPQPVAADVNASIDNILGDINISN